MRKLYCLVVTMVILLQTITPKYTEAKSYPNINIGKATSSTILFVNEGNQNNNILYDYSSVNVYGPQSFYVHEDNSIYILDTLNKRLLKNQNGNKEYIELPNLRNPKDFALAEMGYYIYDYYNEQPKLHFYNIKKIS